MDHSHEFLTKQTLRRKFRKIIYPFGQIIMCTLFTWEFCGPWDTYEGVTHEFLIKQTLERKFRKIIYPFGQILLCTFSPSSFMGHGIPMRGMGHGPWDTYEGVTHEFLTKQTLERKFRKIIYPFGQILMCTFSPWSFRTPIRGSLS